MWWVPVCRPRRQLAGTRSDCCPRPRTPFLLVSETALALAGREGETEQKSVIFNSCLPEKPAKHPHSPVRRLRNSILRCRFLEASGRERVLLLSTPRGSQLARLADHIQLVSEGANDKKTQLAPLLLSQTHRLVAVSMR